MEENSNIDYLYIGNKEIILVGTAHVSKQSTQLVESIIKQEMPDTVAVELCNSRFQSIKQKDQWQDMDIVKVIKDKKAFLLLANLLLASFQKRIAKKFDIKPGQEMIKAIETGEEIQSKIHLIDRDVQITLSRAWKMMKLWDKLKLFANLLMSIGEAEDIDEEEIERMKQQDVLQSILSDVKHIHPVLQDVLITERDKYLSQKIKQAPGDKIVAVVGAGHVPGIKKYIEQDIDLASLEQLPPKGKIISSLKWVIPGLILALLALGFFIKGANVGKDMIIWWIAANGILAGIGATIALGHPLTIISSVLAAPLTSLNPMIAAGWVSGLVEAFSRKPKVRDFENLPNDILSVKGFWKNNITRILLVVVFTNLGSTIGTLVAIPMMVKVMG